MIVKFGANPAILFLTVKKPLNLMRNTFLSLGALWLICALALVNIALVNIALVNQSDVNIALVNIALVNIALA